MTEMFEIREPDDFHVHLRTGTMLEDVAYLTARQFKRALIMPNTIPPILTARDVRRYRREIDFLTPWLNPLMTIQITDATTPAMIDDAIAVDAVAGKVYPLGVTTNSQNGITSFEKKYPVFEKMQETGMALPIHGELPDPECFCLNRETGFFHIVSEISHNFPSLKIILEHITTEAATVFVLHHKNVAATITVHHLLLTLDDVVGGMLHPHHFCKPIAKYPSDRSALIKAATSGFPRFFFGSDSAPHLRENKECSNGCAGVFSAPVALPLLVQIFNKHNALDKLENFTSGFGADFYGLPRNEGKKKLIEKDWVVPQQYDGIVPFMTGETLHWQVAE